MEAFNVPEAFVAKNMMILRVVVNINQDIRLIASSRNN
jgi:hypothetical protein